MQNNRAILTLVVLVCFLPLYAGCDTRAFKLPKTDLLITKADGSSVKVNVELAVKAEERNYGFMNRKNIPAGTGMLFVFERDQQLHFWMKNTPHPLSIAYIDSSGLIRDIFDMTPFSLASTSSTRSVRFALEVPQGWFAAEGISTGDHIQLANGTPLKNHF